MIQHFPSIKFAGVYQVEFSARKGEPLSFTSQRPSIQALLLRTMKDLVENVNHTEVANYELYVLRKDEVALYKRNAKDEVIKPWLNKLPAHTSLGDRLLFVTDEEDQQDATKIARHQIPTLREILNREYIQKISLQYSSQTSGKPDIYRFSMNDPSNQSIMLKTKIAKEDSIFPPLKIGSPLSKRDPRYKLRRRSAEVAERFKNNIAASRLALLEANQQYLVGVESAALENETRKGKTIH